MQRHDLLRVDAAAWQAMLERHPHLVSLPLVKTWAKMAWPVIVRRSMTGDPGGGTPAALPLPPANGKQRIGFSFASLTGLTAMPKVLLRDAATSAPSAWQPVIQTLVDLGETVGVAPHVYGALLWGHLTGLEYLTDASDLDLLWSVTDATTTAILLARLTRIDAGSPVRLDGEIILPDGGGVAWRELAVAQDGGKHVLVKTMSGVGTRSVAELFARGAAS